MSVPKTFIEYMKIMREYYKSGASNPDELFIDFNFDDIEIDARSYGFINNDDIRSHETGNDINNKSHELVHTQVMAKADQQTRLKPTEIITIKLFEQDHVLMNGNNKLPVQPKQHFTLADKIKAVFSNLTK
ncbi:hypothetical protein H4J58_02880 [Colwellia sp. MB3u-70]|uniref:hypothetical protein n=1 Tax=unclassified Colwellia TaxID=196834 RepID=UPI0015F53F7A|nr:MULTISPECIES: hypothetical protein [unclassified Colwellia]MBA6293526.1 hypothetical protein [Colwellia sp. MB3u-8]MBA6306074.1 hypothetical protein [Colwellia sp. MB3u-70]